MDEIILRNLSRKIMHLKERLEEIEKLINIFSKDDAMKELNETNIYYYEIQREAVLQQIEELKGQMDKEMGRDRRKEENT